MLPKLKILFLCTGNSCRSQMAEGWARSIHGDRLERYSAGTRPSRVDPRAVDVMCESGVDISVHRSKHLIEDLPRRLALSQHLGNGSKQVSEEAGQPR